MDTRGQAVQTPVLLLSIWRRAAALRRREFCLGRRNSRTRDAGFALESTSRSRKQGRAKGTDHAKTETRNACDDRTKIGTCLDGATTYSPNSGSMPGKSS